MEGSSEADRLRKAAEEARAREYAAMTPGERMERTFRLFLLARGRA